MIKIRNLATPIKDDGGTKLGAMLGAIVGIILAYCGLSLMSATNPIATVLTMASGLILGIVIGSVIGGLIDLSIMPDHTDTDKETDDRNPHDGRMH